MADAPPRWRLTYAGKMEMPTPVAAFDLRRIVGRITLHAASHLGRVSYLIWEVVRGLAELRIWIPRAFEQGVHVGYGSLFIVMLTAGFAGGVTALQTGYQFTGNIPLYVAAGVITESIILELGPVLTALILAGRIGARYAAELGSMRVTEQIDALESLGRSSVSHLIIPRVVAGTLMVPILVIFADVIGIWAGWLGARGSLGITNADFAFGARYFFKPWDLWYSMIKALFFGLAITVIPCYMGFSTKKGAEGVGRATTAAVVTASVMILFLDALLAQVLLQ
jgi:phospholipid/cholesterol/gamma-HCH transport system permease protein